MLTQFVLVILPQQHLKATMMKVSDPIMFGHCVKVFYKEAFEKHGDVLDQIGANPNDGLGSGLKHYEYRICFGLFRSKAE